jgi:hypothetical protein
MEDSVLMVIHFRFDGYESIWSRNTEEYWNTGTGSNWSDDSKMGDPYSVSKVSDACPLMQRDNTIIYALFLIYTEKNWC